MPFSSTTPFYHTCTHNSIKTVYFALTDTSHTTHSVLKALLNHYVSTAASSASPSASSIEAFIPNENGDLMQYCECTNDFVNAIIDDYFNSFEIRKYYINKYEQPYYGVLSYLYDIGYTVEYELLPEAHLQDYFDTATGSVDVKEFAEDGVIHVYSNETGKDVAQIPLTKLAELEKEVKDFVEYKLSAYKVANPTKRSDLVPKSIYAFDIPNEIARVKRYKEYAEYCLKQLEQMQKEC